MNNVPENRVLLSSVCQPFGTKHGDGFGASYEGSHQLMWAQGIFRTRGTTTQWGIDFIAANLQAPTTVLHYPTMRQFIAEVKKGYKYVGIAFVSSTLHKMRPMVEAIRRYAPETKIVLGGYGTALGEQIAPYGDHICKEEGVAFMRRLLGEPVDAPIVQPDITQVQKLLSVPLLKPTGYIFAGLGCPNGCDFCATSHYFDRKHIRFLPDGPSILAAIENMRTKHPGMDTFWINDEDFLLNKRRGRGFLQAIRASDLPPLSISIFSSVKALSQYSASELVEMGVDWIWVGFEGKRAGYAKMDGRSYQDLFADLRAHGISLLASMIIGFDYQTREIIMEEFEELIALRPSMSQFIIYGPPRGTPLYERITGEDRLLEQTYADNSLHDGFTLVFKHPHIGQAEMSEIQRHLYREEFRRLGPSAFRVAEDFLTGHVALRNHQNARVRAKAVRYGQDARASLKIIQASKRYVSPERRRWLDELQDRMIAETGRPTTKERVLIKLAPALLAWEQAKLRLGFNQQPEFTRRTYRTGAQRSSAQVSANSRQTFSTQRRQSR
ncbi:MAG: hypothetical protein H6707_14815 [Deltaproteobacteria bacterium]|nr:hypothetical protein [Deltaproteobacteria bacterium]